MEKENLFIVAIDFDGCICDGGYPDIQNGKLIEETVTRMRNQLNEKPETEFILWTCRAGDQLEDAINFCKHYFLPIKYFNEHHPRARVWFQDCVLGQKIYAHEYWDDKAIQVKKPSHLIGEMVENYHTIPGSELRGFQFNISERLLSIIIEKALGLEEGTLLLNNVTKGHHFQNYTISALTQDHRFPLIDPGRELPKGNPRIRLETKENGSKVYFEGWDNI